MTHAPLRRILIVDDEAAQMRALCDTLGDHGYETSGCLDGKLALETLRSQRFDLLLADLMMPEMDGIALLTEARRIDRDLVGIIMTGEGTIATAVEAMKVGALDYILKPFKLSIILPVLARALAVRDLRIANEQLERSVKQRTVELETANRELESFAYSVSHDLRSPLGAILGNAELLIDFHSAQLTAAALPLLNGIIASAERMGHLIEDLLRLSRIGRQPIARNQIAVSALVGEVLDELERGQGKHRVDVRVERLLDCEGDPGLLKQVFANLLSNAIKFTGEQETPVVELTCRLEGGEKVYTVRDNGVGFDMRRAKELFTPFHRLDSAKRFEGTGVGLSIVHRIVDRHGGRIWAESELGKGASFHFSMPA